MTLPRVTSRDEWVETQNGPRTCSGARIERDGRQPLVARFGGSPYRGNGWRPSLTANRSGGLPAQGAGRPAPGG